MWWELLKRFPNQPPFGESWFGAMRDTDHPLAVLRILWIKFNIELDEMQSRERRKDEIEYGGFFASPDVYFKYKGLEEKSQTVAGIKIVTDDSAYDRKIEDALAGKGAPSEVRSDIAERIARHKRDSGLLDDDSPPVRINESLAEPEEYQGDSLEVEHVDKKTFLDFYKLT